MKKKNLKNDKRFGEKFDIDKKTEKKEEDIMSFSLTPKETKLYKDWIASLWEKVQIDDDEDSYVLYPKIQFEPYEMGMMIRAIVGKEEIILRMAWEDDNIKRLKK